MGKISKKKLAMTDSFRIFGVICFPHPLPEKPTKQNIKETDSKGNILGPIYTPKDEGLDGG